MFVSYMLCSEKDFIWLYFNQLPVLLIGTEITINFTSIKSKEILWLIGPSHLGYAMP